MTSRQPSFNARFYLPLILLWGGLIFGRIDSAISTSVISRSAIDFEPYVQRNDLMVIESGKEASLNDLILYSLGGGDLVARVIGVPGDTIAQDLRGRSIYRNSEAIVVVPPGHQVNFGRVPMVTIGAGELGVYVQDFPRTSLVRVIAQSDVIGPVGRIYRAGELKWHDWAVIAFFTVITVVLICLPYVHAVQHRPHSLWRLGLLIVHSVFVLILGFLAVAPLLPGDPLRYGMDQSIWWWIPLAVMASFDVEPLALALGFLGAQWLRLRRRRASA